MKGKSADLEFREKAFAAYRECGGNVEASIRELKALGYSASRPTFYALIEKFNFKERLAAADAKMHEAQDAGLSLEEEMLSGLMRQKKKYEQYFESLGKKTDHQAQYAYANLLDTILSIKSKLGADRHSSSLIFLKDFVLFLQKEDPDAVPVIEKHLDAFAAFVKEKYVR